MMPNLSEIYDSEGLVIGTAAELSEDDECYVHLVRISRLMC